MVRPIIFLVLFIFNSSCGWLSNEGYRTRESYNLAIRGTEEYFGRDSKDSYQLADEANTKLAVVNKEHFQQIKDFENDSKYCSPVKSGPATQRGQSLENKGEFAKAIEAYEEGIILGEASSATKLGMLFEKSNDKRAQDFYKKGMELGDGLAAMKLGMLLEKSGKKDDEIVEKYKRGIQLHNFQSAIKLGLLYDKKSKYSKLTEPVRKKYAQDAKESFLEAAKLAPGGANTNLGLWYEDNKELGKAKEAYRRGIRLGEARAAIRLGLFYEEKSKEKDHNRAIANYKKSLQLGEDCSSNLNCQYVDNECKSFLYNFKLEPTIWPRGTINQAIAKAKPEEVPEVINEFGNGIWLRYLRDLVTEPSLNTMAPVTRKVDLACAPPPEQVVLETASSIAGKATVKGEGGSIDAKVAERAIRLFEQTERTVFLQYAMFRLCEMGINSRAEFRNAFALVMQELIRQAAGLSLKEALEEKRFQRAVAELEKDRLECVKNHWTSEKKVAEVREICGVAREIEDAPMLKRPKDPKKTNDSSDSL